MKHIFTQSRLWLFGLIFTTIVLLGWITLRNTLSLALIGDDWLLLYTIRQIFDVQKSQTFWQLKSYLCTYCPHYSLLSLVKLWGGYNPIYYYLVSGIIRCGIAILLASIVYKFTNSKLMCLIMGCLWVTTYQGIQTSDWVFNFNHYLGVGLVGIFSYLYYNLQNKFTFKGLIFSGLIFISALVISPPRMHGLFPFICLLELIYFLIKGKQFSISQLIVRIVFLLGLYKLVFLLAQGGYGTAEYNWSQIKQGLEMILGFIKEGKTYVILNPIASIGNYFLPDATLAKIIQGKFLFLDTALLSFKQLILPVSICMWIICAMIFSLLKISLKRYGIFLISSFLWIEIIYVFLTKNRLVWPKEQIIFSLIGGFGIITTLFVGLNFRTTRPKLAYLLLSSLAWMTAFSILPWVLAPYSPIVTWMRYSLQQSAGIALWWTTILGLIWSIEFKLKNKLFVIAVVVLIVSIQIGNTHEYINILTVHRSQQDVQTVWDEIHSYMPSLPSDKLSVVYLKYDDYYLAEWGLRFGFASRGAIEYNVTTLGMAPLMIYDETDLKSFVTDGAAFAKYGEPVLPISINDIYAFKLSNKHLSDITKQTREELNPKKQTTY